MRICEKANTSLPLTLTINRVSGGGVTGQSPTVALRDGTSTDLYIDWNDLVFKTSGWTTKYGSMTEIERGHYQRIIDPSAISGIGPAKDYVIEYRVDDGGDVKADSHEVLRVVESLDDLATATAVSGVQADTDNIQTRLPAALEGGRMASVLATTERDDIVDRVWDEVLTGATHNVPTSSGRRLRQLAGFVEHDGSAQGGTINTITLDAGASPINDLYVGELVSLVGGTGQGQSRVILAYNGSTKVAYLQRDWEVQPVAGTEFVILAHSNPLRLDDGIAQGGGPSSITLRAGASGTNDIYVGQKVILYTGTGAGQARVISAYNGTTKVATVMGDWEVNPDATSVYTVLPLGRSDPGDSLVESGFSYRRVMKILGAAVAGNTSGGPDGFTARNLGDTDDLITGTADSDGNRTVSGYGT